MAHEDDDGLFEYHVGTGIEELEELGWSEKKIARFLREKAKYLDPRKPRRRSIDPLTCSDKDFSLLSKENQDKFKPLRDKFQKAMNNHKTNGGKR